MNDKEYYQIKRFIQQRTRGESPDWLSLKLDILNFIDNFSNKLEKDKK